MKRPTAIVIGAGLGGISAATHLARGGYHVTVFERTPNPGGRCDYFVREGHRFDVGPTLFVMPLAYEAEFQSLGTPMREVLDLLRVDPTYQLFFDDGSQLSLTSDMKSLNEQVESLEAGSFGRLLRYLDEGCRHYDIGMRRMVTRNFRTAAEFLSPGNLPMFLQLKALSRHYRSMSAYFTNPRLKTAFTFQDMYMGLSPFEAPATFSLMPYSELAHGVWYPRGGMYRVVEALVEMAQQAGVEFVYDTTVEHIEVQGSRATGVLLEGGRRTTADILLANADLPYVYDELLPDRAAAKRLSRKRFSCSVISFFWGLDRVYPQLGPHTLFLADEYRENFTSIIRDLTLPENPSLYIHAPTRLEPSLAPAGQESLTAIVPVGHLDESGSQDWEALRDRARQAVFNRLSKVGITDLEKHIKFETNLTPPSWHRRYNLMKGSTHGLSHTLFQLGYFRPANRHPRYQNLYFSGASTHPGTGMPTALISGRLAAERIFEEQLALQP
jgi:phytoene desaturase